MSTEKNNVNEVNLISWWKDKGLTICEFEKRTETTMEKVPMDEIK